MGVFDLSGNGPEFVQSARGEIRGSSATYANSSVEDASLVKKGYLFVGQVAYFRCAYRKDPKSKLTDHK